MAWLNKNQNVQPVQNEKKKDEKPAEQAQPLKPIIPLMQGIKFIPTEKSSSTVIINNNSNILFDFAKCCNPEADKRLVPVEWDSHELVRRFKVTAKMNAELFGEIDGAVKKYNGRLIAGSLDVCPEGLSGTFTVSANNEIEMRKMLTSIRQLPTIIKIQGID